MTLNPYLQTGPDLAGLILIVGLLCALIYGVSLARQKPSFWRSICKTVPLTCLTLAAWLYGLPVLLIAALGASALGDMALSHDGEKPFLAGLGYFLIAHVFYILLFWQYFEPVEVHSLTLMAVFFLAIYSAIFAKVLWPHLGNMRLPVSVYICAIFAMGLAAVLLPERFLLVRLGAVAFILSDSILAIEIFIQKRPALTTQMVWLSYSVGQGLIFYGFL